MNTLTELKHKIKYIPQLPGIYKMLHKEILFISAKVSACKKESEHILRQHIKGTK